MKEQWYYIKPIPFSNIISHDLEKVWEKNITGKRINIAIIGGGFDFDHQDLRNNFDPLLSYNFVDKSNIISKCTFCQTTETVGFISAIANNQRCGVGAAPSSKFVILQVFNTESVTCPDTALAKALIFKNHIIHIYVLNWRVDYRMEIKKFPGSATMFAFSTGIKFGRNSLGSIYVAGSGDLRSRGDNCAFNALLQSPGIFVFGSITPSGEIPYYTERCNAIIAASLSTSEYCKTHEYLYTTSENDMCTKASGKSHASTAISAGILALLLSYDQSLTIRQIMRSIVLSSHQLDIGRVQNAAGLSYSYSIGFGMLDAAGLIEYSKLDHVKNLLPEHECLTIKFIGEKLQKRHIYLNFLIYSSGCLDRHNCVSEIEQTVAIFSIRCNKRKSMDIQLTSPSGTKFTIVQPRDYDTSRNGFINWKLKIMGYYGENPQGVWSLHIISHEAIIRLMVFQLIFYGTCMTPRENLIYHNNIKKRICLEKLSGSLTFINKFCASYENISNEDREVDPASFSEVEYSHIVDVKDFKRKI